MPFLVLLLVNAVIVVGGGETYDVVRKKLNTHNKSLAKIHEEVQKKTTFNIDVKPVINFNPNIKVSPTIKSNNINTNKNLSDLQNKFDIVDGE